mgnify:CR=1 FL=1
MLTDQVYNELDQNSAITMSETLCNPKMVQNKKMASKKAETKKDMHSEAEVLVSSVQNIDLLNSVAFTKDQYLSVNYLPSMLNDIHKFCMLGNSILHVDTTFELLDGLWLTDTTYTHEGLVNLNGKNPEFPGPGFWHFRKTRESYRRFAYELVIAHPGLLGLKKVGHDLDQALVNGFTDVFPNA